MKALLFPLLFFPCVGHATDTWFTGLQEIESTGEVLAASDILVESYRVDYSGEEGPWTFEIGLGWNRYRIDYQPILFGTTERLDEGTWQGDLAVTREWSKEWSGTHPLQAASRDRGPRLRQDTSGLRLVYAKARNIGGVSAAIQTSTGLGAWQTILPPPPQIWVAWTKSPSSSRQRTPPPGSIASRSP